MRIENIQSIKDFRIFKSWTPSNTFEGFSDINLIYANNGSGKSTLASLLSPSQSSDGWNAGVSLEVSEPDKENRAVTSPEDSLWDRVSVFNKAYIAECFDFELGEATALLAIGKENADRERDLRAARSRFDGLTRQSTILEKAAKRKEGVPQTILKDIGTLVTSTLGGIEGYGRSYTSRSVSRQLHRAMSAGERASFDSVAEITKAQSAFLEQLPVPPVSTHSLSTEAIAQTLARVPTARLLDSLSAHPKHAAWVQEGLSLHRDAERCLFCTGALTQERLSALNRHFDESTLLLQKDLRGILLHIDNLTTVLREQESKFVAVGLLYPEYQADYKELLQRLGKEVEAGLEQLSSLRKVVETKLKTLHEVASLPEQWVCKSFAVPNIEGLRNLLNQHNSRSSAFEAVRKTACEQLEAFWIGEQADAHTAAVNEAEAAKKAVEDNETDITATRTKIRALENEELDPAPPAKWLNQRLHSLLGRSDIRIEPVEGNRYAIYRHGEPAFHLSEGECTALALLYFVRSLSTHGRIRRDQIVVIDDPVSSLDDHFAIGASSLLWAELIQPSVCGCGKPDGCPCNERSMRDCGQVFLLTHNFELFRTWSNQLDRLPNGAHKEKRAFRILELEARAQKIDLGTPHRIPTWRDWGSAKTNKNLRTRLRSEYHYLFWRAATTLIECGDRPTIEQEMDAAVILPNVCRRLLEGFLSFRFPENMGDFRVQMQIALDALDHGLTRQRLVTYLHQHSHQERVETTRGVNRPEAVLILHAVFELIRNEDKEHFIAMCAALNLNHTLLAGRTGQEDEELEKA